MTPEENILKYPNLAKVAAELVRHGVSHDDAEKFVVRVSKTIMQPGRTTDRAANHMTE